MRNRILIVGGALIAVAVATPALANPVTVDDQGPCYNVAVHDKNVLPNGLCYLGPPPPK
ncbi:MAG: hypothetical protein QOJ79_121 [Actinomycetota bacterium]|jgi:hypothetical protein|nr:hypothetical protein [Actinomycetota bacterium]